MGHKAATESGFKFNVSPIENGDNVSYLVEISGHGKSQRCHADSREAVAECAAKAITEWGEYCDTLEEVTASRTEIAGLVGPKPVA